MTAFGLPAHRYQSGSCVVCGKGADTAIGVRGVAEWHIAVLQNLGVPRPASAGTFAAAVGMPEGTVPAGVVELAVRVCQACVDASATFAGKVRPALFVHNAALPCIEQPAGAL